MHQKIKIALFSQFALV